MGPFGGACGRRFLLPRALLRSGVRSEHPNGPIAPVMDPVGRGALPKMEHITVQVNTGHLDILNLLLRSVEGD